MSLKNSATSERGLSKASSKTPMSPLKEFQASAAEMGEAVQTITVGFNLQSLTFNFFYEFIFIKNTMNH